ncbi:MAG TPA: VOC family protein [Patescibacteria group bacterium]|nr:VOC family protein [Patescibacteria group bacterium]
MAPSLRYVVEFVADMDRAIHFYRDTLGLPIRFESPEWSELSTGDVTLALQPASEANPPGTLQLGFSAAGLSATCQELVDRGVRFTHPPTLADLGRMLAEFLDSEDARCSIGEASRTP